MLGTESGDASGDMRAMDDNGDGWLDSSVHLLNSIGGSRAQINYSH